MHTAVHLKVHLCLLKVIGLKFITSKNHSFFSGVLEGDLGAMRGHEVDNIKYYSNRIDHARGAGGGFSPKSFTCAATFVPRPQAPAQPQASGD